MNVINTLFLASVWSGHPVGFDLLTHGEHQFVAFYDAERRMTVAQRRLDSETWTFVRPEGRMLERRKRSTTQLEWDSHNYLTMALDSEGHLHLAGNMHVDPLIYFRTTKPLDITTLTRIDRMVGENEDRCTYPVFMTGPNDELLFRYRDGSSGNGVDFYNQYDPKTQTWRRLLDRPLLDGQGKMNAYSRVPTLGPDGRYHLIWMWRDTPDCATNHDISYARSRDLVHWENCRGEPLTLPITLASDTIVDPVPPGGGMINMTQSLGFDSKDRPVVSYHKFDANGKTQAYSARLEDGKWRIYQTSDWDYRWEFSGGGSVGAEIRLGGIFVERDGGLSQTYSHVKHGSGIWKLDEATLRPSGSYPPPPALLPGELRKPTSDFAGMSVRLQTGRGEGNVAGVKYVLRWETLGPNRDRPRKEGPAPSELKLYEVRTGGE
jgi:hypothetical protein